MRKFVKNIPVLFMWFAWLGLTAHLLIPHDHHLFESFNTREESCPASNGNTGHHSEFPIHCHAFNDLASEKAITFVLTRNIVSIDFLFSDLHDALLPENQIPLFTLFEIRKPFPDSYLLELSALRAPPSVA
jgi:hypothetical protein